MTNFQEHNNFFLEHIYPPIIHCAFYPTHLLDYVVDTQKKISDYNAKDIANSLLIGILAIFPLTVITFSIALKCCILAALIHTITSIFAIGADLSQQTSSTLAR